MQAKLFSVAPQTIERKTQLFLQHDTDCFYMPPLIKHDFEFVMQSYQVGLSIWANGCQECLHSSSRLQHSIDVVQSAAMWVHVRCGPQKLQVGAADVFLLWETDGNTNSSWHKTQKGTDTYTWPHTTENLRNFSSSDHKHPPFIHNFPAAEPGDSWGDCVCVCCRVGQLLLTCTAVKQSVVLWR